MAYDQDSLKRANAYALKSMTTDSPIQAVGLNLNSAPKVPSASAGGGAIRGLLDISNTGIALADTRNEFSRAQGPIEAAASGVRAVPRIVSAVGRDVATPIGGAANVASDFGKAVAFGPGAAAAPPSQPAGPAPTTTPAPSATAPAATTPNTTNTMQPGRTGTPTPGYSQAGVDAYSDELSRRLTPATGKIADVAARGNAGIREIAGNPEARTVFNALQESRNNGIRASTDANGRLVLSGDGTNATPAPKTGYDLGLANERSARAVATLRSQAQPEALTVADVARRAVNARGRNQTNLVQLANTLGSQENATAQTNLEYARAGYQNQMAQMDVASRQRLAGLQDRYLSAGDPQEQRQLANQILTMMGHEPRGKIALAKIEIGKDDFNKPIIGTIPVNTETGEYIFPNSQAPTAQRPSWDQFEKAISADPRWKSVSEEDRRAYFARTYGS